MYLYLRTSSANSCTACTTLQGATRSHADASIIALTIAHVQIIDVTRTLATASRLRVTFCVTENSVKGWGVVCSLITVQCRLLCDVILCRRLRRMYSAGATRDRRLHRCSSVNPLDYSTRLRFGASRIGVYMRLASVIWANLNSD